MTSHRDNNATVSDNLLVSEQQSPKGVFAPSGLPKPLPLGEVALRSNDGEGKPGTKESLRSDGQALCQSDTIDVSELFVGVLALSVGLAPAPPKGEPLACRSAFVWTSKARCLGNGSAPLSGPATA